MMSSASRDRCTMTSEHAPINSTQKSRSLTPSRLLRDAQALGQIVNCLPQPESQIGSYLVIAAASRVKLAASVACHFEKMRLNESVDVFLWPFIKILRMPLSLLEYDSQRLRDCSRFVIGQYSRAEQPVAMSYRRAYLRLE